MLPVGPDLGLFEINQAATIVRETAHPDVNLIFGAVIDESMDADEIRITVIATGFDHAGPLVRRFGDRSTTVRTTHPSSTRESVPANAPSTSRTTPVRDPNYREDDLEVPAFLRRPR